MSLHLQLQLHLPCFAVGRVKTTTCPPRARRVKTLATLSQPQSDGVNWVEATSNFFEQDKRPIMLFDGKLSKFHVTNVSWMQLLLIHFDFETQVYAICVMEE